ncbi:MAG: type I-C CRISPR-associated protein Cas8c/Csd1 [Burkholderiales bacterium]|nr:type I-C CRISPR-associated protein Cas8c/Csd1 [Burkholderiales bacterium]
MSVVTALVRVAEQMVERGEIPAPGSTTENISWALDLAPDGTATPIDLRDHSGKTPRPRRLSVPSAQVRTVAIAPNTWWDKTEYVLGVAAPDATDKALARLPLMHKAWVDHHLSLTQGCTDPAVQALVAFLAWWTPDRFEALDWPQDIASANVVFSWQGQWLHDLPAARDIWDRHRAEGANELVFCLATGTTGPLARLHPAVKGVRGAATSGARLVTFNSESFESYGREQGACAPMVERTADLYGLALNAMLRDRRHSLAMGDTTVVWWCDATDANAASEAETLFGLVLGVDPEIQSERVRDAVDAVRIGRSIPGGDLKLPAGVRFHVLGLGAAQSRLVVRFWLEDDFAVLGRRLLEHLEAVRVEPAPRTPSLYALVQSTTRRTTTNRFGNADEAQPRLAGELLRAVLTGGPYPQPLLHSLINRVRAEKTVDHVRAAGVRAVLTRSTGSPSREVPVALDTSNTDTGYLLGRLFAAYERAQQNALGPRVNATIRDRYFASASTAPRSVFPLLQRMANAHLASLRKEKPGLWVASERLIGGILSLAGPDTLTKATLSLAERGMFTLGYYHQREAFFTGSTSSDASNGDVDPIAEPAA